MRGPRGLPYGRDPSPILPPAPGLPPASEPMHSHREPRRASPERPDFATWWRGTAPFDKCGSAGLVAAGDFTTVVEFQVPHGFSGLVEYWGGQGEDVNAGASVQWQIVVAGQPLSHAKYDRCGDWIGLEQNRLCELRAYLTPGDVVELRAKNHHGTTDYAVCGRLKGTLWPSRPGEVS